MPAGSSCTAAATSDLQFPAQAPLSPVAFEGVYRCDFGAERIAITRVPQVVDAEAPLAVAALLRLTQHQVAGDIAGDAALQAAARASRRRAGFRNRFPSRAPRSGPGCGTPAGRLRGRFPGRSGRAGRFDSGPGRGVALASACNRVPARGCGCAPASGRDCPFAWRRCRRSGVRSRWERGRRDHPSA